MAFRFDRLQAGVVVLVLALTTGVRAADESPVTSIEEITNAIPAELFPPKDKPLTFELLKPMNAWFEANYQGKKRLGRFTMEPTERMKAANTAVAREVSEAMREGMKIVQHVQVGLVASRESELKAKKFVAEGAFRVDASTTTGKDKVKRMLLMVTLREPKILPAGR